MKDKDTETTRYLCAAAYSNEGFCNKVIEQVLKENRQALAPCYGVDLPIVVKHCLVSNSRRRERDFLFTLLFFTAILFSFSGDALGWLVVLALFVLVVFIVYRERWETRHVLGRRKFSSSAPDLETVDWETALNSSNSTPRSRRNDQEIHHIRERLAQIAEEQSGNVVLYGKYAPFVGCGYDIGGWSFTISINKGKEAFGKAQPPEAFEIKELYQQITHIINNIHLDDAEVSIGDIVYIDGRQIRDDKRFLNTPFARPSSRLQVFEEFVEEPGKASRCYKRIQIFSWRGELIVSIVLRCTKFGQNLYVGARYFLLPPLRERFHAIDRIQSPATLLQRADLIWQSIVISLFLWPLSFSRTLYELIEPLVDVVKRWINVLIIKENPAFNYGSITSIREDISSSLYRQYFQVLDKDMYLKVVEGLMLDGIVDFLDQKNIDTSEIKSRQTQILNEGIILSGGEINAKSLAVGNSAQSFFSRPFFKRRKTIKAARRKSDGLEIK